uniref:Uncharacterized protein n=1 Tax=Kalanchoe fedtschenkoi TaxID=63787 RepID=A0A7N0SY45_KALFE
MGCSTSKLDEEEVVQLCRDRRNFIKQAVEHRFQFASRHIAYIQSLKRVSAALRDYADGDGDEPAVLMLDSAYITPPFAKQIHSKRFSAPPRVSQLSSSSVRIDFFRPGGNPAVLVEETPMSPETARVQSYSPAPRYGYEGFFQAESSSYFASPPRRSMPPPSPQTSQWDFFWNPFSSLDYDYYHPGGSYADDPRVFDDDDVTGLRKVREEEGIPELEEESEHDEMRSNASKRERVGGLNSNVNYHREEVLVEDVDEEDDEDEESDEDDQEEAQNPAYDEEEDDEDDDEECVSESEFEAEHELQQRRPAATKSKEISETRDVRGQVKVSQERAAGREMETMKEEKPAGFAVYVNRRPTSMGEVVRDLEEQFMVICKAADEVSSMLDASRAHLHPSSGSNDSAGMKMLNPVALLRSASSRSASSRYLTSTSGEGGYPSSRDFSGASCILGSHQSTLDRLYAWEKKLYEEVRSGERVRMTYEKKCALLRKQDVKGEDDIVLAKTRAAIRNLHTQIKVSMHTVEAISKRIRTLMIDELQPQVQKLVQGLSRMWKVMAECHQLQKRTLDEAKLLLAAGTSSRNYSAITSSALKLESELRNWRNCFESWISHQRSYAKSLAGWVLRCLRCDAESFARAPFSPRRSAGVPPVFGICIQWSKLLDSVPEVKVIDGLEFFAAGVGSVYAQQMREESRRVSGGGSRRFPHGSGGMLEVGFVEEEDEVFMNPQKMAEFSMKVLCAGMSVAVSSLREFAVSSSEGYAALVKQSEEVPS